MFPTNPDTLIEFMAYLVNKGYTAATVSSTTSAVGYLHRMGNYTDPTDNFKVKKALIGVHRLAKSGDQRLPITQPILHKLLRAVEDTGKEAYDKTMIKAMFLLMFYGLLRVGEITIGKQADKSKVINFNDVKVYAKGAKFSSLAITMRDFKHNLPTNSVTIKIKATHREFCPVSHVMAYLGKRGGDQGPLFVKKSGNPVSRAFFRKYFTACVAHTGLDKSKYKPHCFRIGGTTRYAELGYSDAVIQRMGRWKSPAFRRYIRMASYDEASR